ncbi:hypothetical protein [Phyllobacterium sp. K27]
MRTRFPETRLALAKLFTQWALIAHPPIDSGDDLRAAKAIIKAENEIALLLKRVRQAVDKQNNGGNV